MQADLNQIALPKSRNFYDLDRGPKSAGNLRLPKNTECVTIGAYGDGKSPAITITTYDFSEILWENYRRISQRMLMANFFHRSFGLVLPGLQAPHKNSRPKSSAFLSNFTFSNPKCFHADFLLTGETKIYPNHFGTELQRDDDGHLPHYQDHQL